MKVELSDHFTYKKLFKLTFAPILMVLFISFYSIADGIIISNCASHDAFAGVNLIYPITLVIGGLGFIFGHGGAALTSKRLGEGKLDEADHNFTNIILVAIVIGLITSLIGFFIVEPVANALANLSGETSKGMINEAIKYGQVLMIGQFAFMLQLCFQNFFIVDEKPLLGFLFALGAGATNIIFDLIFIIPCKMGAQGAAIATVMGYAVAGIGPFFYFITHNNGNIRFVKPKLNFRNIGKSCVNGLGEFMSNISISIVSIIFNIQLLRYFMDEGQLGVEAYGVIMYVLLIFTSIFIGYSTSTAPVVSYHYGANNFNEVKNVVNKSLIIISITSVVMCILGVSLAYPISLIFATGDKSFIDLTTHAMRIWSISFLFVGINMYASSLFAGLNNGLISLAISFTRTMIFQIAFVFLLPLGMNREGIWWSNTIAEACGLLLSVAILLFNKKKYQY